MQRGANDRFWRYAAPEKTTAGLGLVGYLTKRITSKWRSDTPGANDAAPASVRLAILGAMHLRRGLMKARFLGLAAIAILLGGAATSLVYAQAVSFTPDQLKWTRNPATGSELAPLMGDGRQPGPFIVRVRYPANLKAMPHSHPADILVTVISGTLRYAEGKTFDEAKFKDYPAGSFIVIRANVPHYETAIAPMEFQAHGTGPQAFIFVDPEHDPRNKK